MGPTEYFSTITRLIGSAMIVSSLSGLGFYCAGLLDREIRELDRLETALTGLSAEISYALLPLREALRRQGNKVGGTIGEIFGGVSSSIGMASGSTPPEALDQILSMKSISGISREGLEIIRDVMRNLGSTGYKEQARLIRLALKRLELLKKERVEEAKKRAKIYRFLGVMSGLSAAILLI